MRKANRREKILFMLAAVVVGTSAVYAGIAEPRLRRAMELRAEIERAELDRIEAENLLKHRDEIRAWSAGIEKQMGSAGDDQPESKLLLEEIERLAKDSELTTLSLRPQSPRDLGLYRLLSVEVVAEGTPADLARFLYEIRGSRQLLRVDRLQVDALREAGRIRTELLVVKIMNAGGEG